MGRIIMKSFILALFLGLVCNSGVFCQDEDEAEQLQIALQEAENNYNVAKEKEDTALKNYEDAREAANTMRNEATTANTSAANAKRNYDNADGTAITRENQAEAANIDLQEKRNALEAGKDGENAQQLQSAVAEAEKKYNDSKDAADKARATATSLKRTSVTDAATATRKKTDATNAESQANTAQEKYDAAVAETKKAEDEKTEIENKISALSGGVPGVNQNEGDINNAGANEDYSNDDKNLSIEGLIERLSLILLLIALALSLAALIIVLLAFFLVRKKIEKEKHKLKNEILEEFNQNYEKIETEIKGISKINSISGPDYSLQIKDLETQVKNLERIFRQQEADIHLLKNPIIKEPPPPPPTSDEILAHFNSWAANPSSTLSSKLFYYLKGDVKMRTLQSQLIKNESHFPTMWIMNREGNTKFVFPNPNFFDQRTDITMLYNYDLAQLKIKGQNRIKIIDPCKISDEGFIEFIGKLQLI
jgi:hypothetical protein